MIEDKAAVDSLRKKGWGLVPPDQWRIDLPEEFLAIWKRVSSHTMTSAERGFGLYGAVNYLCDNRLEGDFVECGVWKGGSCMLMVLALLNRGDTRRNLWLYDTFSGMTKPGGEDVIAWNGLLVADKIEAEQSRGRDSFSSWAVEQEEVRNNLSDLGYPVDRFRFIQGDVEDTLPPLDGIVDPDSKHLPEKIALLRLDTDWYASTKRELEALYPRLVPGGILVVDDYGHFRGARKAVDEYFANLPAGKRPYLNRLDYTGRIGVKT